MYNAVAEHWHKQGAYVHLSNSQQSPMLIDSNHHTPFSLSKWLWVTCMFSLCQVSHYWQPVFHMLCKLIYTTNISHTGVFPSTTQLTAGQPLHCVSVSFANNIFLFFGVAVLFHSLQVDGPRVGQQSRHSFLDWHWRHLHRVGVLWWLRCHKRSVSKQAQISVFALHFSCCRVVGW